MFHKAADRFGAATNGMNAETPPFHGRLVPGKRSIDAIDTPQELIQEVQNGLSGMVDHVDAILQLR